MNLDKEAEKITELLAGKIVESCIRNEDGELLIKFQCGTKLFVNSEQKLDFSITGC